MSWKRHTVVPLMHSDLPNWANSSWWSLAALSQPKWHLWLFHILILGTLTSTVHTYLVLSSLTAAALSFVSFSRKVKGRKLLEHYTHIIFSSLTFCWKATFPPPWRVKPFFLLDISRLCLNFSCHLAVFMQIFDLCINPLTLPGLVYYLWIKFIQIGSGSRLSVLLCAVASKLPTVSVATTKGKCIA